MIFFDYLRWAIVVGGAAWVFFFALLCLFHLVRQSAEAFMVIDKLSKGVWLAILICSLILSVVILVSVENNYSTNSLFILSILGAAVTVYWVDIRPQINDLDRRGRY